jgi:hypothetical protein
MWDQPWEAEGYTGLNAISHLPFCVTKDQRGMSITFSYRQNFHLYMQSAQFLWIGMNAFSPMN